MTDKEALEIAKIVFTQDLHDSGLLEIHPKIRKEYFLLVDIAEKSEQKYKENLEIFTKILNKNGAVGCNGISIGFYTHTTKEEIVSIIEKSLQDFIDLTGEKMVQLGVLKSKSGFQKSTRFANIGISKDLYRSC